MNYLFTIPVIILSTLTGTANFAMDSFVPEEHKQIAMAAVGSVNIFAGILSTLQNFLRYAELMESHRLSEVQWSKFGRNIEVELALDPKRRKTAHDFMKLCRAEYDRLIEQSPPIDDKIIKQFKNNFKNIKIKVPPMCNGLDPCKIYVPEVKPEEKIENIIVNVGEKLRSKRKPKKWTMDSPKLPKSEELSVKPPSPKSESKRELDELKTISRVSSFRDQINKGAVKKVEETDETDIKTAINRDIENGLSDISETVEEEVEESEEEVQESEPEPEALEPEPEPEEVEPEPEPEDDVGEFLDGISDDPNP